jgi:hypothetical protein
MFPWASMIAATDSGSSVPKVSLLQVIGQHKTDANKNIKGYGRKRGQYPAVSCPTLNNPQQQFMALQGVSIELMDTKREPHF